MPDPVRASRWRFALWLVLAAVVIVLDQFSKALVVSSFAYGEGLVITGFFNLVHVLNHGAAFSFLAGESGWQRWFFVVLATAISLWLSVMIWRHRGERLQPFAFVFILGGALGNVIDRVRIGAVIDFLDFHAAGYHFPAFNLADSAITLGVILLLAQQLFERPPHE